jgi:hypothetical protein
LQRRSRTSSVAEIVDELEPQIAVVYERIEHQLDGLAVGSDAAAERDRLLAYLRLRREGVQLSAKAVRDQDWVQQGRALEKLEAARALYRTAQGKRPAASTAEPPTSFAAEAARFALVETRVLQRYQEVLAQLQQREVTAVRAAEMIEREVLPPWRAQHQRFNDRRSLLAAEHRAANDRLLKYMGLREESWNALVEGLRQGNQEKITDSRQKSEQADAAGKQVWRD